MTLKQVILTYLNAAGQMDIDDLDKVHAYEAGMVIGLQDGEVELTVQQYDVIKKLSDKPKLKTADSDIFGVVVSQQAKRMIDAAPVAKTGDKKQDE